MFFRRVRPKDLTIEERLDQVQRAGFTVEAQSGSRRVRISRGCCAVVLSFEEDATPRVEESAGIKTGGEIGELTDAGFQKFFVTPSGKRKPALASDLRALHDFQEDLKEALGEVSLYNEALGTVSTFYLYDRVKDRDRGVSKRAWE
jgi:hypothetical protein